MDKLFSKFMALLHSIEYMITSLIDSGLIFFDDDIAFLRSVLSALSKCNTKRECYDNLVSLLKFARRFLDFLPYDEKEVVEQNLRPNSKFLERIFESDDTSILFETIRSFAVSLLDEIKDFER